MKRSTLIPFLAIFLGLASLNSRASDVSFKTVLTPAGSFTSESHDIEGVAKKVGDTYVCDKATLKLNTLKSGIDLRDEHMLKKYFEIEKFPTATVTNAVANGNTFHADLEVHGVKKPITGSAESKNNFLVVKFTAKMSDFAIAKANYLGVGAKDDIQVEASVKIQ